MEAPIYIKPNQVSFATCRPGKGAKLETPLEIHVDGPFGAPASDIFRAEHAVLICTGIGVTPFASILQVRIDTRHSLRKYSQQHLGGRYHDS